MRRLRFSLLGAAFALLLTLVLASEAGATPAGEIAIPAGDIATLTNAAFGDQTVNPGNCPADRLAYGYEVKTQGDVQNVQVATGVGCDPVAGATIGPFKTRARLRVFLQDVGCGDTFYSNGGHALVTAAAPGVWTVSIMDSDLCASGPGNPRVPVAPGTGNFNVTVTLAPAGP